MERLELIHDPSVWTVTLCTGDVLRVTAHAFAEVHGDYRFVILMEAKPPLETEVLRLPGDAVKEIRSA